MADSSIAPEDRIRVFNRSGFPIAEFRASVSRSWAMGMEGRAQMILATKESKYVNSTVLNFGNWLLVESSVLPAWIGMIDVPRAWSTRSVEVNAFSPERIFQYRRGGLEEVLKGSAGSIFEQLLQRVNLAQRTIVQGGSIWKDGPLQEDTLHPEDLAKHLSSLQEKSQEEYAWEPRISTAGTLAILGHWVYRRGIVTGIQLQEGRGGGNIEATGTPMIEDEPLINDILGYGDGSTWSSKANVQTIDQPSIDTYGLRQGSESWSGVTTVGPITNNNQAKLKTEKSPTKTFNVNALNVADLFIQLRLGNQFQFVSESMGFTGNSLGLTTNVRIIGMGYDPSQYQKVSLILQEVL